MPDTKTIKRSRRCGLKDIYIAEVTKDTETEYTTATPVKLARALSAKITDKFTQEKIYSDDGVEEVVDSYEGTDIEISVNALAPQDYALLYENLYKNGFLIKASGDKSKVVAIGYRSKRRSGKYEFVWYYCGNLERPDLSYETEEGKVKTQTETLKGSFYARQKEDTFDGVKKNLYSVSVDEDNLITEDTTAKQAITNWFAKVQEYLAPAPAAVPGGAGA